jgi:hypothetical protein
MPRKSKIPTGPGVEEIFHQGRRIWIVKKTWRKSYPDWKGMRRCTYQAHIEGYRNDTLKAVPGLSRRKFREQVLQFVDRAARKNIASEERKI